MKLIFKILFGLLTSFLTRFAQTIFIFITIYTVFDFEALSKVKIGELNKWETWAIISGVCVLMNVIGYTLERRMGDKIN